MNKYKLIALYGPAGAGKDTILKFMVSHRASVWHEIVSCTTRPPRDYEQEGVDYFFLSNEDFAEKVLNGSMLEATSFNGWHYGTPIEALKEDAVNIGVFNIAGIECLREDPRIDLYPVEVWASDKQRLLRQLNREETPNCEEICRRFKTDKQDFADYDFTPWMILDNDKTDIAITKVVQNLDKLVDDLVIEALDKNG